MPSHRQRYRCASRRADRPSGRRTGTARSRHGDPVGSPVRYASRAGDPTPRGRAVARHARYASTGAGRGELPPSLPARLAGERGDAVASPTLPLRIAPCPIAPKDAAPALLARVTATPSGRQFATPRAPAIGPLAADPHRLARIAAAPTRVTLATPRPVRLGASFHPASRHGSLAGVAMPSHRQRYRCASRRADRSSGGRAGTARSRHGDPVGSPVRYASRAGNPSPHGRPAPARSLRLGRCGLGRASTRPPGTARWRAWRCRRIANATAAHRAVPIAQRSPRRHCSLASRRPRRVAGSLRLARRYQRHSTHDLAAPS